jgi:hypothetical protein
MEDLEQGEYAAALGGVQSNVAASVARMPQRIINDF